LQPPLRHGSTGDCSPPEPQPPVAHRPDEGKPALQEILTLYDFATARAGRQTVTRNLIDGIMRLSHRRLWPGWRCSYRGIARGVEVALELDEEKYLGTGMLLFASVLERFFALYASVNSFTQLVATDGPNARFL